MVAYALFWAATLAILLSTASFAWKNEGIRGAGRIVGGAGLAVLGLALTLILPAALFYNAVTIAVCGVATSLFGLRKFLRRNNSQ